MGVTSVTAAQALDVHGLRVRLSGDWPEVLEAVCLDFAWFADPSATGCTTEIEVQRRPPEFDSLGERVASFVTPRNVVYSDARLTAVDYFGRALALVDHASGRTVVQGEDPQLVHEVAYLRLLSLVGEHLDRCGLPRLHALGLSGSRGAVAVMLPSGGGKSTLALKALHADGVRLLSEDTPLLDSRGRLHPFPLRMGINETDAESVGEEHVRRIERMEFHPKLVLDLEAFAHKVEPSPQPLRDLVIGRRSLGTSATLEPLPRRAAVGPLFREAVVGVGVYQGMEFVLQHGMRDVVGKAGIAARRAACCAAGLRGARVWRLTLGRDREANWEALSALLR